MLEQTILSISLTIWACGLWALLPKAFSLHLRRQRRVARTLKPIDRSAWKAGALATASLLALVLVRISEN